MKCLLFALSSTKSHVLRVLSLLICMVFIVCVLFQTKCAFSNQWFWKPLYKEWLWGVKGDKHRAQCIVYMKAVDITSIEELALTGHFKGNKHQTLRSQKRWLAGISDFLAFLLDNQQLQVMTPKFQNLLHLEVANTISLTPLNPSLRVHQWWKKVSLVMRQLRQKFYGYWKQKCLINPINHAKVWANCFKQCFLTVGL